MVYMEKGGKGNGYKGKGIYAGPTMAMQRMGQIGYVQGIPPPWHSETAGQFSLDQYHKELADWHRMTTHLDPALKMDLIVNALRGAAAQHIKLWLTPQTAAINLKKVASFEIRQ